MLHHSVFTPIRVSPNILAHKLWVVLRQTVLSHIKSPPRTAHFWTGISMYGSPELLSPNTQPIEEARSEKTPV